MSLGGNVQKKNLQRLQWNSKVNQDSKYEISSATDDSFNISLNPMEIKTFIIKLTPNEKLYSFL